MEHSRPVSSHRYLLAPRPRHARWRPPSRPARGVSVVAVAGLALGVVLGSDGLPGTGPWRPALPASLASTPLGTPATAPPGGGGYTVLQTQDDGSGRPVAWDPCRPVPFVVRSRGAVPGGRQALDWAVGRVSGITGLRFVDEGATAEVPRAQRPPADRDRYGDRWSPVLVAWTDASEYPGIARFAALGGPTTVGGSEPGTLRHVSGVVLLNRDHLAAVAARPDGARLLRAVILHELGHLVGLDHVDDETALMSPRPGAVADDVGPGDLRGLVALSRGVCFSDF